MLVEDLVCRTILHAAFLLPVTVGRVLTVVLLIGVNWCVRVCACACLGCFQVLLLLTGKKCVFHSLFCFVLFKAVSLAGGVVSNRRGGKEVVLRGGIAYAVKFLAVLFHGMSFFKKSF